MIVWLRTCIFFAGWIAFTLTLGVVFLPALVSQRTTWLAASIWVNLTLLWLRIACGIRSVVRGREHLPDRGGLVACKHQSAWDTLILWKLLGNPAFILKRELYRIPIFGWYLWRCGHIGIERGKGRNAIHTVMDKAGALIANGRTLVIFPEGTRLRPGEEKPFHAGVARLSAGLQLRVTPAALNAGCFWPKTTLRKFPGTAVIAFLPPPPPATAPLKLWLEKLQNTINAASAKLV